MPNPRLEEGSSASGQEEHEQQQDVTSELDYKDQGRDYQSVLVNAARVDPTRPAAHDVSSEINYKDQGRDYQSMLVRPQEYVDNATVGLNHHHQYPTNVNSEINYKDQGRDYQSMLVPAHPRVGLNHHHPTNVTSEINYKDQGRDYQSMIVSPVQEHVDNARGGLNHHHHPTNVTSEIDYKDQGRDYQSMLVLPAHVANAREGLNHHHHHHSTDVTSEINYKDQGREYQSMLVSPANANVRGGVVRSSVDDAAALPRENLPSTIDYKDLGRDLESIMPHSVSAAPTPPTFAASAYGGDSTQQRHQPQSQPPPVVPWDESPSPNRKRKLLFLGFTLCIVALVVVGIVVAVVIATGGNKGDEAVRTNPTPAPASPTIAPPFDSPSLFPTPLLPDNTTATFAPSGPRTWTFASEPILGESTGDKFGYAVDLSANASILAASAHRSGGYLGRVRIFRRNDNQWDPIGSIDGQAAGDQFGWSVALSKQGSTMAVGSIYEANGLGERSGSVRVYRLEEPNIWRQIGRTIKSNESFIELGFAIDLNEDGTICAVTLNGDDDLDVFNKGSVVVFQYDTQLEDWTQIGRKIFGGNEDDFFGFATRLNYAGDIVLTGASPFPSSGYARVDRYDATRNDWYQVGQLIRPTEDGDDVAGNFYGAAVALSADGTIAAVAAPFTRSLDSGSAFVQVFKFDEQANQWNSYGQTIRSQTPGSGFGYALDISAAGDFLIVGAIHSAQVTFYQFDGANWNEFGETFEKDGPFAGFGGAVSLSADGRIGAFSAFEDNEAGANAGKVIIVERDS